MSAKMFLSVIIVILPVLLYENAMAGSKEGVVIGQVEEIILLPWYVRMPARIDTGAAKSSLDARDVCIDKDMVVFRLPEKYGGKRISLPLMDKKAIRSAHGRAVRPIVEIEVCIGNKRLLTAVNLTERSGMEYPFLIGRNILNQGFVVDVSKSNILPPTCTPE